MTWIAVAALLMAVAVALGAFGAHALREKLTADRLTTFQTGVQYQVYHAIGLLAAGTLHWLHPTSWWTAASWLFVIGILLFSGSLYGLATTGRRAFGPITPIGGLCFLAGWVLLAIGAFSSV